MSLSPTAVSSADIMLSIRKSRFFVLVLASVAYKRRRHIDRLNRQRTCTETSTAVVRSARSKPSLHGSVSPVVFSVTGCPCRIPANFPRRAASEALELGASTWQAGCARIKNSCFPCRYSTRTSFLVEKLLALLAFQQGKPDGGKVLLFFLSTWSLYPPTRKTRHGKHLRVE